MMRKIVFELCADNIDACLAASEGGADRIELCSALDEGGLTPGRARIPAAVERTGLPIHAMLRPRGGGFVYSDDEFAAMRRDLLRIRELGIRGVVLGLLRENCTVDIERTAQLVEAVAGLEVTFHRAIDHTADISQALEDVIRTGCRRVLTSGGEENVESGVDVLSQLVTQAAGRIEIAVGGGLRVDNATKIARSTGASHFHSSLGRCPSVGDVRAIIQNLNLA